MTKIDHFSIGQRFFQATLLKNGKPLDNYSGECWSTRDEAEADGAAMVADYDPEWQKRHPGEVEAVVRECEVESLDSDGQLGAYSTVD